MMTYNGKGKNSLVPWTCKRRILLATRIEPSFFNNSNYNVMQNVEFASTLIMKLYLPFYLFSTNFGPGWFGIIFSLTPSESGFYWSFPSSFNSKKKLIFELFLKGIFIIFLLGILTTLRPVFSFIIYFKQIICGTSPLATIGNCIGSN